MFLAVSASMMMLWGADVIAYKSPPSQSVYIIANRAAYENGYAE